jgi:hypothetical protein
MIHYNWSRRQPLAAGSGFFVRSIDRRDRSAVILLIGAIISAFAALQVAAYQLLLLLAQKPAVALIGIQSLLINSGAIGLFIFASQRDRLENPYLFDPFNGGGLTPVVGVKWDTVFDAANARVDQAQAELEALNHKQAFAALGVPFEVGEAYAHAQANYDSQRQLREGAAAARRWLVASLADFAAGMETADKMVEALKNYVFTQTEYVRTINDYNMNVAQLARLTGEPN